MNVLSITRISLRIETAYVTQVCKDIKNHRQNIQ